MSIDMTSESRGCLYEERDEIVGARREFDIAFPLVLERSSRSSSPVDSSASVIWREDIILSHEEMNSPSFSYLLPNQCEV